MNEEIADDFIRDWRQETYSKLKVMRDLHQHAFPSFLKCPDHAHPFRECLQMMKADFKAVPVDDLLGGPGNRDAGTRRRHYHYIAIRAAFQITNVAVMWQNFRPQFQIRRCFEDRLLRRAHGD
jgi:hypothetical protein